MEKLLSTKEVAQRLGVNEKMVYTLITEKGLPATKITGKWLFPAHLVEQWVESMTINYPTGSAELPHKSGLLMIAGSDDILLDRSLSLFMKLNSGDVVLFGAIGSLGGLKALRRGMCHIATSHLAEENENDYNFSYAASELDALPAVVNFCRREQGLIVAAGNPHGIAGCGDIAEKDLTVVNRALGASTCRRPVSSRPGSRGMATKSRTISISDWRSSVGAPMSVREFVPRQRCWDSTFCRCGGSVSTF
jgi:excisionase family DNA binding protein